MRSRVLVLVLVVGAFVGVTEAIANGIPTAAPVMSYAGTMYSATGVPQTTQRSVRLSLWDAPASGGGASRCAGAVTNVTPDLQGHFSLPLDPACVAAVQATPDLWVQVEVDGVPLTRTKLGALPYAVEASRASTTSQIITATSVAPPLTLAADGGVTLVVGPTGAFTTLQDAWGYLQTRVVRTPLTVQLQDGAYSLPAAGLELNHPDGALIQIVGNQATPASVAFNAAGDGFRIGAGGRLGLLNGLKVSGPGASHIGITVIEGAFASLGPNLVLVGFDFGVVATEHATVTISGLSITGNGSSVGVCVNVDRGSYADINSLSASSCSYGVFATGNSTAFVNAATISSAGAGIWAGRSSFINVGPVSATGVSTPFFRASEASSMFVSATNNSLTFSPAVGAVGNNNSVMLQ
jgi:hypothetical protein